MENKLELSGKTQDKDKQRKGKGKTRNGPGARMDGIRTALAGWSFHDHFTRTTITIMRLQVNATQEAQNLSLLSVKARPAAELILISCMHPTCGDSESCRLLETLVMT